MTRVAAAMVVSVFLGPGARAVELQPQTVQAFDRYIRDVESRLVQRLRPGNQFLWTGDEPGGRAMCARGRLWLRITAAMTPFPVPGGLIHDWIGAVFIPVSHLGKTLALMQDYDHNQDNYKPEVLKSRLVSREGNDFKVYLRLMKKKVITVVLDTDYDVRYFPLDGGTGVTSKAARAC